MSTLQDRYLGLIQDHRYIVVLEDCWNDVQPLVDAKKVKWSDTFTGMFEGTTYRWRQAIIIV